MSQQLWVGGLLAASGDSQNRPGQKEESAPSLTQQSSSRQDPWARGPDEDYVAGGQGLVGSYRGECGEIPGYPGDAQSLSGHKEWESARSPVQSSSRQDPRARGTEEDYMVGGQESYRGEVGGGISGHPTNSQIRSDYTERENTRSSVQQGSSRQDPRARETDEDMVGGQGGYRGEVGGGISGHPTDSQSRSDYTEKESARSSVQQSSSHQDPRVRRTDENYMVGGQESYRSEVGGGILGHPTDSQSRLDYTERESARSSMQQSSNHQDPRVRGTDEDYMVGGQGGYQGEVGGGISGHPTDSQSLSDYTERESALLLVQQSSSHQDSRVRRTEEDYMVNSQESYRSEVGGRISGHPTDSQSLLNYTERENTRSSVQQSSNRQDPRVRGIDEDVTGSQVMSGGSSRIPYTERDHHALNLSTETTDTTAHSFGFPPNPTTSIPQSEEDSPPYNTRGLGWERERSSQPAPSQYETPYSHPSQVQGLLDSQLPGTESSRPWDPSSNPSFGAAASHLWGGQPTTASPKWSTNPPHCVFFLHLCVKTSNHNA